MSSAPVALFVYNRPLHTQRTIESLLKNYHAKDTDVVIFSDAAKTPEKDSDVRKVRQYINSVSGFKTVSIVEREKNYGLANSIIDGVTSLCDEFGCVIVLEDDMVTSPFFLQYMNDALEYYCKYERVISIHGYVYPVRKILPETFFLRGADCWGWATWQRGWKYFNADGTYLLSKLRSLKLARKFNYDDSFNYIRMLEDQIAGKNDSWAIRWHASAYLNDKLTLYPGQSLVDNIGNDSTGTHCSKNSSYEVKLCDAPIRVGGITVEDSDVGRDAFISYGRRKCSRRRIFVSKIGKLFTNLYRE